jgi:hypothetical protein
MKPYDPQVGEIWWFGPSKKHYLFLDREQVSNDMRSYKWRYSILCLENGRLGYELYGTMNAHGEGWFRKVA